MRYDVTDEPEHENELHPTDEDRGWTDYQFMLAMGWLE